MEITIQPAYQEPEAIRELLVEYTGMLLEQNPAFAGYLKQQNFAAELDLSLIHISGMAELVDVQDLGSCGAVRVGRCV